MHNSMQRSKPDPTFYYFGILIAEKTIVQVFKSSNDVKMRPAGQQTSPLSALEISTF